MGENLNSIHLIENKTKQNKGDFFMGVLLVIFPCWGVGGGITVRAERKREYYF